MLAFKNGEGGNFNVAAKLTVIGAGGAGGNAINRMIEGGLDGVEFVAINTDKMALEQNRADTRIQIGQRLTKGLGAGANPEIGRAAMEEGCQKVENLIKNSDMVFITAGLGGGTGTGSAPIIAKISKKLKILTIAIVTYPFRFEGRVRENNAKAGIEELKKFADTIIIIQNQKLLSVVDRKTPINKAFKKVDEVLFNATKAISDLISIHGLVNLDFADVRTIMNDMGEAIIGLGEAEGQNRAARAAHAAINNEMLDEISIAGAKGILINITGGNDLTLFDVGDATQAIYEAVGQDSETNIIFGAVTEPKIKNKVQVTIIATGINESKDTQIIP
jgi:cell division protein FtsZ